MQDGDFRHLVLAGVLLMAGPTGCGLTSLIGGSSASCHTIDNCPTGQHCCDGECRDVCESLAAGCGDGVETRVEACDDGNTLDGDYCSADCSLVTGFCGDGVQQANETCDDGSGNSDQIANACRTDCSLPRCGDAVVDAGEACESGDCCDTTSCQLTVGIECSSSAEPCGAPDTCDGLSADCPVNGVVPSSTLCRPAVSVCDLDDYCDGVNTTCTIDAFVTSPIECRATAGLCDVAEQCDMLTPNCPPDIIADTSVLCNAAIDLCDVSEMCDGTSVDCPADGVRPADTICRPASFECDAVEVCDGSVGTCAIDDVESDGTACRGGTCYSGDCEGLGLLGTYYDHVGMVGGSIQRIDPTVDFNWNMAAPDPALPAEYFSVRWSGEVRPDYDQSYTFETVSNDGVRLWVDGVQLIDDWTLRAGFRNTGPPIALTAGVRYPIVLEYFNNASTASVMLEWNSLSVSPEIIPQRRLYPTVCGNGIVDQGETCDGVCCTADCTALRGAGTACRPSRGECDVVETCDGLTADCPGDAFLADLTACTDGTCDAGDCWPDGIFLEGTVIWEYVSIEAEHYDRHVPALGHAWVPDPAATAGYSGDGALAADPAVRTRIVHPDQAADAPRLDFKVRFVVAGTHYVWVRGWAPDAASNSCHLGLDGVPLDTASSIVTERFGQWSWTDERRNPAGQLLGDATIDIPSAGDYVVNLWMREDGFIVDKILLVTLATFDPLWAGATGPAESTRAPN